MKKRIVLLTWGILAVVTLFSQTAAALPTFQVYAPGAVAGDQPGDQDTWFINAPATITVVGAFDNTEEPPTEALTDVRLLFSVPEGQTGTIWVTPDDALAASKVSAGTAFGSYATKADVPAPTGGPTFNNHAPTGDGDSDFYYFDIGDFDVTDGNSGLWNYNADDGSISYAPNAFGVELSYAIGFSGFERVHIDVYGFAVGERGTAEEGRWKINPASHDTTVVIPAPGAVLLCGIGVGLVGWLRRRKTL